MQRHAALPGTYLPSIKRQLGDDAIITADRPCPSSILDLDDRMQLVTAGKGVDARSNLLRPQFWIAGHIRLDAHLQFIPLVTGTRRIHTRSFERQIDGGAIVPNT
jgi:hypothetical protein